jgi:hypothetical protein
MIGLGAGGMGSGIISSYKILYLPARVEKTLKINPLADAAQTHLATGRLIAEK